MSRVFDPARHPSGTVTPAIGGKAANLWRLQQQGCPVPDWVAVPAEAFFEALAQEGLGERIAQQLARLDEGNSADVSAAIRDLILDSPLPEGLVSELQAVDWIGAAPNEAVSVRSSAADEDGARHSFAGIHESYLYVRGLDSVVEHIRRVWASGYQQRALLYRRSNGLTLHPVPMAVIIQRMVDAHISGVAFTADPTAQDPFVVVVSSLYGLGEGLVGAGLAADHAHYDKRTRAISVTPAEKETQLVRDPHGGEGLVEQPVPESLRDAAALSTEQLDEVIQAALAIERARWRPQDIEFCFDAQQRLFILQTRDITTVADVGPAAGHRLVWDNSNIIESYSGVTSPMTFSFIRHAYTVVYHCFSEVMGIPRATVKANQPVFENMLGLIQGQVYYNLMNWYRLIQQFPGYGMNKRFMESMMGLREQFDPEDQVSAPTGWGRKWLVEFPKLLRLALRMIARFSRLDRTVARFQARFMTLYQQWEAMDFDRMPPHRLMDVYRDMEQKLLWNWQAPIINDFYVMIHYGALRAICRRWCGDESQSLQNDLICGNGDIESTEPTRMLMKLALRIRRDPAMVALFQESDHKELARRVPVDPACAEIAAEVQTYLERYGFRCINELKLEEPSLRETPEFVYQILQNYLQVDESLLDAEAMEAREREIRAGAERTADEALRKRSFTWLRRIVFRRVLRNARKGVRNRENMRFARTRIYGVLRELIQAMGRHLVRVDVLDDAYDIFYLTIDEVWDYVKGTAVTTDLRGLVSLRRKEFDGYRAIEADAADDHFETYGIVYVGNRFREIRPVQAADGDLVGTGCCPGQVTAPVRIVRSPRDDLQLNGCILVAARTDPGWVPLYPAVSGILIERGSILSHSAIVAREMGIPAIVGIPGLLERIEDGQIVTMNGQTGIIQT
ncbi:MAG: phosphoenolpyruvate synthase [Planctomycetaceae bacterium]|nr:MAG: phosphoenolpyruvate synthase [Planctomycetaceae bacterium]